MYQWLIELLQELQQKSRLEQLGYAIAVVSTVVGAALGYKRLVQRKYAKMQEEYERLSAETESHQLRIKDLKAEIVVSTQIIDALRARVPEFQLEIAEKERLEGNETKAIPILEALYNDLRPSISRCCFQLGEYHLAMYIGDPTADQLDAADRLVRISSLLQPERKDVCDLLGEIEAIRADSISRTSDHQGADAHWDMALDYVGGGSGQNGVTLFEKLNKKAQSLFAEGRPQASMILLRRAVALGAEHLGPDHLDTLAARHGLAVLYRHMGRYDEAESLFQEVVAKRELKLGADHPDTLNTRNSLAVVYTTMGRYPEAERLFKDVLAKQEQKLGPDHPSTLLTRANFASLHVDTGRHAAAEPLLKEVLAKAEQKLGLDHPSTLAARHSLAWLHARTGRHQEAEPLLKEVLAEREQKLGPDHPDTLRTRHNLAWVYVYTRRYGEAEPVLKEVLAKQEQHLGADHPTTLTTRHTLASLYWEMGRHAAAEPLLKGVLAKQEQKLGPDHPDTLLTRANFALLCVSMDRHAEAEPLLRDVLAKREQKLGPDHPITQKTRTLLDQLSMRSGCKRAVLGDFSEPANPQESIVGYSSGSAELQED
jgi:tetratricopeptide (TPR) repeat protein